MTNKTSLNSIAFYIALAVICISLGCEQQRYSASPWTPATGANGTLPGVGQLGSGSTEATTTAGSLPNRTSTLPGRNAGSLPWRAGNRNSLPNRAGGTLPSRQQVVASRPKKKVKPPIPSIEGKPVWDTREKPEMPRVRGKLGLYMGQDVGMIELPNNNVSRGAGSTLPARNGSTLPARARRANWSTLPGRE